MAGTSPHSSGQASSPFGTEATLYSPLLTRNSCSGYRRQDATVNKINTVNGYKGVLPLPPPSALGTFLNEMSSNDKDYMSRHMFVAQLADGTYAGENAEHEMFCVQHQMKLVSHCRLTYMVHLLTTFSMRASTPACQSTLGVCFCASTICTTSSKPRRSWRNTASSSITSLPSSSHLRSHRTRPISTSSRVKSRSRSSSIQRTRTLGA